MSQSVKDAFSTLGLMIDWWQESVRAGQKISVPLNVINDTDKTWSGKVTVVLRDSRGREIETVTSEELAVEPLVGRQRTSVNLSIPKSKGIYEICATIGSEEHKVDSYRLISVGGDRAPILTAEENSN